MTKRRSASCWNYKQAVARINKTNSSSFHRDAFPSS